MVLPNEGRCCCEDIEIGESDGVTLSVPSGSGVVDSGVCCNKSDAPFKLFTSSDTNCKDDVACDAESDGILEDDDKHSDLMESAICKCDLILGGLEHR